MSVNFSVSKQSLPTDAVTISGIPVVSDSPTGCDYLFYNQTNNQLEWGKSPELYAANEPGSVAATASTDFTMNTDQLVLGDAITRATADSFNVIAGNYELTMQFEECVFGDTAAPQTIEYQFYDQTATAFVGNKGIINGANTGGATDHGGNSVTSVVNFGVNSIISARCVAAAGLTPTILSPSVIIKKIS